MEKSFKFKVGDIVQLSEKGKQEERAERIFEIARIDAIVYSASNMYQINSFIYYEYKLEHATKLRRALE